MRFNIAEEKEFTERAREGAEGLGFTERKE
jgi:hypothetical protein